MSAPLDQNALANELRRRAERVSGRPADDLCNLATLIRTEASPYELARWLTEAAEVGRNGDGVGPDQGAQDARAALEGARVDLIERIRDGIPEREYLPGGDGWLIAGKRYLVFSPSGVGKTIGTLVVAVEVVRHGGTVAIIDVENGADEYARRLELIFEDQETAAACSERLRYYEYPALSLEWGEKDWVGALADCDLIVFDSSRHVLSALGLAEDANDDYAKFMGRMVMPLSKAGTTTIILDNTGHDGDHPRGASAKRDLNEVLFELSAPTPFDLEAEGRLVWRRTRQRFAGAIPKALEQRIGGGTYGLPVPTADGGDGDHDGQPFRPTFLMERVSRYVEFDPGCSQAKVLKNVEGRDTFIVGALRLLIDEGYIRREPKGNSHLHYGVTEYREAEDDLCPTSAQTSAQNFGVDSPRPLPTTAALPKGEGSGAEVSGPPLPKPSPASGETEVLTRRYDDGEGS